ncbi:alpha- and gamma-adaptin-binding protein p34 [Eupeodes corollae]|uniref:alpha- and gamma-adaptin-binding protein p34 n=1 Tax=Eupeodes corollae TaxID=290404 RepID=UPI002490122A|nr:alpha- and gamma-adaptin-binding protein p34 [Eupeodes corollae]
MIESPIVLIASEGKVSPLEIINKIRKIDEKEDHVSIDVGTPLNFKAYKYHLTTKYYKTNLLLLPLETELDQVPAEIIESVEAFLIYFDSGNRGFSKRIGFYADFVKAHQIELGILLCDRLYDDSNEGITYKEAKQGSNLLFDVIELERSREEDEEDDPNDPLGYDEVQQALRSFVWSNIDVSSGANKNFLKTIGLASPTTAETSSDENSVEAQLEIFENLLSQVQSFRTETATWSRDQVLDHAEKLAEEFVRMMNEEGVGDEDDDDDKEANENDVKYIDVNGSSK